jgi:phage tail protein X
MAGIIHAQQGDTVDLIALRHYGSTDMVQAVLASNPGLAGKGPILPQGTPVTLPPAETKSQTTITLWD